MASEKGIKPLGISCVPSIQGMSNSPSNLAPRTMKAWNTSRLCMGFHFLLAIEPRFCRCDLLCHYLNKQGSYIGCIYFTVTQVDRSQLYIAEGEGYVIDVGTDRAASSRSLLRRRRPS